jgi:hypothetical protein
MRRQLVAMLCTAGLVLGSGAARAQNDAGVVNQTKTAYPAAQGADQVKRPRHQARRPNTRPLPGRAATAAGAIRAGEKVVKTDKTVNDNTMKILPP